MKFHTLSLSEAATLGFVTVLHVGGCSESPSNPFGTGGTGTTGGQSATGGSTTTTGGQPPAATTGGSLGTSTGGTSVGTGGTASGGSSGGASSTSGGSATTGGSAQGGASGSPSGTGGAAGSPTATGGMAAGGAAGSAGAAGMSSVAGAGGGSGGAVRSSGCGVARTEAQASYVRFTLDVSGTMREYYVYLPKSYDAMRAYPVVYQFHGAGGTGKSNNVPIEKSSGVDALVVGGTSLVNTAENRTQWQFSSATSPDLAFFDALVTTINAGYCVDTSRLFATGFSSGGWMCNLLGCLRPTVLRAYGIVAGGIAINTNSCSKTDGIAARFIHDLNDTDNAISGNQRARDRLLTTNGCGTTTAPEEPSPCVRYQGCRAGLPVDWCETTGKGHSVQAALSGPALWRFFASF